MKWEESYIGSLRSVVGNEKLIIPSIRAIIENEDGKILFVKRIQEDRWGLPAGGIERNESIFDCLVREVKEETGIQVDSAIPIALYTNPKYGTTNKFGDEYQLFELLFYVERWNGTIDVTNDETSEAKFYPIHTIPPCTNEFWSEMHKEVLDDFIKYKSHNQFILK